MSQAPIAAEAAEPIGQPDPTSMPGPGVEAVTIGESLALLDPAASGPPRLNRTYRLSFVGAESNLAIGLQRLGVHTEWISRLGDDGFGRLILDTLAAEGVDVHRCTRDPDATTAIMIKTRLPGETRRLYYRAGSAATKLVPFDLAPAPATQWLHVTGITLGLSRSACDTALSAVAQAREAGLTVSFDLNYRPGLWASPREARAAAERLIPQADWLLCGTDEAELLFGAARVVDLEQRLRAAGARSMVIRDGASGAYLADEGTLTLIPVPRADLDIVDEVGAGDAFDAGFVFGRLRGRSAAESVNLGHRVAAHALTGTGDWETLPYQRDLTATQ